MGFDFGGVWCVCGGGFVVFGFGSLVCRWLLCLSLTICLVCFVWFGLLVCVCDCACWLGCDCRFGLGLLFY